MAASEYPNIIVLITDTFRRDNLGDRAARPVRTPALDRFAADRATELTGLTMGSFPTIPHRTDFASGRAGWPHYGWQPISHSTGNHIATLLAEQGYFTQLICDTPHLFKAGLQVGFQGSYQHRGQEGDLTLLHMNDPVGEAMPRAKTRRLPETFGGTLVDLHEWTNAIRTEADTFCARTAASTATWLERNYRAGPFFLWVDFFDPHEPWDPPEYLVRRYDPDYDGPPMLHPNYGPADHYSEAELRNLWAHYAAEAELVDRHIGRILEKIDDLDLWRNSLVVVMADHGMAIGEHGCCGKSSHVDEDGRFWPLYPVLSDELCLIAGRAQAGPVPAGARLDLLAQPFDLLPTLCELAGVEIAPPEPLHGRSFAHRAARRLRHAARSRHHRGPHPAGSRHPGSDSGPRQHAVPARPHGVLRRRYLGLRAGRPKRGASALRPGSRSACRAGRRRGEPRHGSRAARAPAGVPRGVRRR